MAITYSKVSNPRYVAADNSAICVEVVFNGLPDNPGNVNGQVVTFCATPIDCQDYGRAIYSACVSGKYGTVAAYVTPQVVKQPTLADRVSAIEAVLKAAKMM